MTASPAHLRVLAPALFAAVVASLSACDRAVPDASPSGPAPEVEAAPVAPPLAPEAAAGPAATAGSAPADPAVATPTPSAAVPPPTVPPPASASPRPASPVTSPVAQPAAVAIPAAFAGCSGCHSVAQGAPHKIGPNLFGVAGAPAGSRPGYAYSPAMAEVEITWTRDNLDQFLQGPRDMVPGTKMGVPPVRDPETRRSLIAYLETLH